uniref:Uncharacterized protein n=1 Tax=Lotharella oceanica TaxID=641309 RepID=A0A7S2TX76_9EUKA|mmetsp:Transcript_31647/g.59038  ORF Transcript_31647/g.59038 Transcript_31647/m.59038 type:complete len:127 (+) Transcript_31647:3-383(+)
MAALGLLLLGFSLREAAGSCVWSREKRFSSLEGIVDGVNVRFANVDEAKSACNEVGYNCKSIIFLRRMNRMNAVMGLPKRSEMKSFIPSGVLQLFYGHYVETAHGKKIASNLHRWRDRCWLLDRTA